MTQEKEPAVEEKLSTHKKKLQSGGLTLLGIVIASLLWHGYSDFQKHQKKGAQSTEIAANEKDRSFKNNKPKYSKEQSIKERFDELEERERHSAELKKLRQQEAVQTVLTSTSSGGINAQKLEEMFGQDPDLIFEMKEKERVYGARRAKFSLRFKENEVHNNQDNPIVSNESYIPVAANTMINMNPTVNRQDSKDNMSKQEKVEQNGMLIETGTVISGVLGQAVNSDYQGPWKGMITRDVYDSSQEYILLPKGTTVIGDTVRIRNANEPIQARMGLTVKWLIPPGGKRISLENNGKTLDMSGIAGIKDEVDRHILAQFLGVSAYALISSSAERNEAGSTSFAGDIGDGMRQQFGPLAAKYLSLVPTIHIKQGHPIKIFIQDDIYVQPAGSVHDSYLSAY